jgi:hypothetical protein
MQPPPRPEEQVPAQEATKREAMLKLLGKWSATPEDKPPGYWEGVMAEFDVLVTKAARYDYLCAQARSTISIHTTDMLLWYIPGAWRGKTFDQAIDQAREAC